MHLCWMEPENYCSILKIPVSIHWFCDSWIQYLLKHTDKILLSTYGRSLNFACSTSLTWAENNCNLNWCSCRQAKHVQFDCKDKLDFWFFYSTITCWSIRASATAMPRNIKVPLLVAATQWRNVFIVSRNVTSSCHISG
jgi:hypothetical protein